MNWERIDANADPTELLHLGVRLHGHKGPLLALGIRMGLLALRTLGSSGFTGIFAEAHTGTEPPISCLVDGIQIATGCTAGKGNLRVLPGGRAEAVFSQDGRTLRVALQEEWQKRILASGAAESLTDEVLAAPEAELFTWSLSSS
ncbi:MAG: formylmethanofuran dehydrogenase subunit E family protein [Candidatus Bipolaricaulis sp.]|nr:formylmethanofuran dehydrogenase subunit E family protein [Candidatus Bipolaricaulis sp.]MDY0392481.1 formylmethanofuran dehydrogenase subunit E family protein [Candidatus Bipolaricaulis sp.]